MADYCPSGIVGHCELDNGMTGGYVTPQQMAFQQYDTMLNNKTKETFNNPNGGMNCWQLMVIIVPIIVMVLLYWLRCHFR